MFSVDYPYESTEDSVRFINTAPISEIDRAKICHLNAQRLLRL
jgi:2,3-dihydroxybenzoate decarboxylase